MKKIWNCALLAFAAGLVAVCLAGCGVNGTYTYKNAGKYTAGSASVSSADISEISVDWIGGNITVRAEETDSISFTEKTDEADSDYLLRYAVIGGELKIKFQKSGTRNKSNFRKELTITVPQSRTFRVLDIESVSGDIRVSTVNASEFDLESVSGDIVLADNSVTTVNAESVSGDIVLTDNPATTINAESVSGDISLSGFRAVRTDLETVSGDIFVLFDEADFRIETETVSGRIKNLCGAAQSGRVYSMGSGTVSVEAETVSGDLQFDVKQPTGE